jgi:hypothetical protein
MSVKTCSSPFGIFQRCVLIIGFLSGIFLGTNVHAFTLNVVDDAGSAVPDYKWTVQEDNTYDAVANVGVRGNPNTLSTSIHKSHAKILATGSGPTVNLPETGRYFVSVRGWGTAQTPDGYTLSGAMVKPGQSSVTVVLHANPIPMAQVSIQVFEDNAPINSAPDSPPERALPNFKIFVYDQFGQMSTDGFGNPIGTTYLSTGETATMGAGYVLTTDVGDDTNGNAVIPNLAPGKYGIRAVPNDGKPWVQTSTIEGTPGIDVWIIAGEPPYLAEAGFFGVHAFIGFVLPTSYYQSVGDFTTNQFRALLTGETAGTITGQVVINRQNRPPLQLGLVPGDPVPEAYVGLSDVGNGNRQVYVAKCDANANFNITGVPPGTYTLTMWDLPLDNVIDSRTVVIPPTGGTIAMGQIPVYRWFGYYDGSIFNDVNLNGVRDPGETGIPSLLVDYRFRDGSIYQATVTDASGEFVFSEVFPFFKWIVAESDYSRFKPTGATVYVDKGGPLVNGTFPLLETRTDTEPFPFLLEGMILYNGNNAKIDWGRVPYAPGENGGIVGVVYYAVTRAQADPRLAAAETWEPGIPDVTINLYKVTGYDTNGKPITQGPINFYQTDSWDKSLPTGCKSAMTAAGLSLNPQGIPMDTYIDCAETIPFWNQTKPAVFDGGYAFVSDNQGNPLPAGEYVVEVILPPGYELVKEEDVNAIVAGDTYTPSIPQPALLPPVCVGADHVVPAFHSFDGSPIDIDSGSPVLPYVGQTRPLCDKKLVRLSDGQNAAADFHLWTFVPPAGRIIGLVTDDLTLEFRRGSPRLSDKVGVPFLPISIQDFKGHELVRTYSDEWGQYNALVPSTYSVNVPLPTGVSPNMVQIFLNHPGFDPAHPDPYYNPGYPVPSVNMDVWPGKTTYADTPIVPIRPNFGTLDCDLPDKTPVIFEVNGPAGGPWVETTPGTITITSVGAKALSNSSTRDYGFGSILGNVFATPVGDLVDGMTTQKLQILSWTDETITLTGKLENGVTPLSNIDYQLTVRRGDSYKMSVAGVTLHVGVPASKVKHVTPGTGAIQAAIDSAVAGDLILIAPGLYPENIIMYKNVKLQGYGAASTIINAGYFTPDKQTAWLALLNNITSAQSSTFYIIPGEQPDFFLEQGSGILVLAKEGDFTSVDPARIDGLQITGANLGGGIFVNGFGHYLEITNNNVIGNQGTVGGGIRIGNPGIVTGLPGTQFYQSSFNDHITISHNQIVTNGANGQTIASGAGIGLFTGSDNYVVSDSWICGNFSTLAGAAIGHQGLSDQGLIRNNTIVFNESFDEGGGIFLAGETPLTGLLGPEGEAPIAGAPLLTPGVGNIVINGNLIQGNKGGNIGGGITLFRYNGLDVEFNPNNTAPSVPGDPVSWYRAEIYNNMIVNNLSGAYGAGIAIFDALDTVIVNNTISNNDSTATSEFAFGSVPSIIENESFVLSPTALTTPMPAGIGIQPFSANLVSVMTNTAGYGAFGGTITPVLVNNIVTNNFAYYWNGYNPQNTLAALTLAGVWDMGVFGVPGARPNPHYSLLTNLTGYADTTTNITGDPQFMATYRNNINATQGGAALGNFVNYTYTPMTLVGNYHIKRLSPALDSGDATALSTYGLYPPPSTGSYLVFDIDTEKRPMGYANPAKPDMGADEDNSKGDVNCDGNVTAQDALLALRYVVDNTQTMACPQNGDAAPLTPTGKPIGDGVTNLSDVLAILMRATGMVTW